MHCCESTHSKIGCTPLSSWRLFPPPRTLTQPSEGNHRCFFDNNKDNVDRGGAVVVAAALAAETYLFFRFSFGLLIFTFKASVILWRRAAHPASTWFFKKWLFRGERGGVKWVFLYKKII